MINKIEILKNEVLNLQIELADIKTNLDEKIYQDKFFKITKKELETDYNIVLGKILGLEIALDILAGAE